MERIIEVILAEVTVSMSEFKKNPAAVLREANHRPVVVLNHNRAAFYIVEPRLFEALMDELAHQELYRKAASRLADKSCAIEVDIDDL
ncbi:type II toxin-antitoxin system prevent-host-death family antitoxin [Methyloversatilis discipulorum]|uniref:type II toxin-antitoxin system prevent-host-death family antitoxin n=1 Tax=Methyloversatilis discipulorum TaxID=1119528 RepID=UPI00035D6E35|nr:type II toxin-antitoxin system prevent-host-death family antitoxin [Methyloversatilis discipulorum]